MGGLVTLALPVCLAGLLVSWHLDALLHPAPRPPWRRPTAALVVHAGLWLLLFALVLAVLRRPWCAAANVLALQGVFIIVNNAKTHALREPFVFPDFIFFTDAVKHPRLYLPFLGWRAPLATASGYALALWGGLHFEPALAVADSPWLFLTLTLGLAASGLIAARTAARHLPASPRFDAAHDLHQLGQTAALWQYAIAERADTRALRAGAPFARLPSPLPHGGRGAGGEGAHTFPPRGGWGLTPIRPDIIVIQSESFFDPRRLYPQLRTDILHHYDLLRTEARQHGPLRLDAWGANTVRSEFAFLTGLAPEQLGVHRFHPYRKLARQGVATLASHLRAHGYRTTCLHPYHASFYGRDLVMPKLGFDELVDIRAFADIQAKDSNPGPYLGDIALGHYVETLLATPCDQPRYLHIITMENHGPLHWESVSGADAKRLLAAPLPAGCDDLIAYARHLANADAMLGNLRRALLNHPKPSVLCVFGDHVPIMPKVYQTLGEPDGSTDYLIWRSDARHEAMADALPLAACALAQVVLAV